MRAFHGAWRHPGDAVEGADCLVVDGHDLDLTTLHRPSWEAPRQGMHLRFTLDQRVTQGRVETFATLGDALELTVELDGQRVLHSVRTVDDEGMRVENTDEQGTQSLLLTPHRVKQVICYRRDLKMRKGKIAAQCAHASMKTLLGFNTGRGPRIEASLPGPMAVWLRSGFAKVVLSIDDEEALETVARLAQERGIPCGKIMDSGRTEFHGVPTQTTVAVGPWLDSSIDSITGPDGLVTTKLA